MTSQVVAVATPMATSAVVGRPNRVCAAAIVITPLMVPGLAADIDRAEALGPERSWSNAILGFDQLAS
jgi:hypothetical protein